MVLVCTSFIIELHYYFLVDPQPKLVSFTENLDILFSKNPTKYLQN